MMQPVGSALLLAVLASIGSIAAQTPAPTAGCSLCPISSGDIAVGKGASITTTCTTSADTVGCNFGGVANCRICIWDSSVANPTGLKACPPCVKATYCSTMMIPTSECGTGVPTAVPTPAPTKKPKTAEPTAAPTAKPTTACALCPITSGDITAGMGASLTPTTCAGTDTVGCNFGGIPACRVCIWDSSVPNPAGLKACPPCVKETYCSALQIPAAKCATGIPTPTPTLTPTRKPNTMTPIASGTAMPTLAKTMMPTMTSTMKPTLSPASTAVPTSACKLCPISSGDIMSGLGASITNTCTTTAETVGCNFGGVANCRVCVLNGTAPNPSGLKTCPPCVKPAYCASGQLPASSC